MLDEQAALLHAGAAPAAGRARHPPRRLGRARRGAQRDEASAVLRTRDLAGADAAQPRRRASVPVRVEPLDLVGVPARGSGQRRVGAGAGQGAARAAAVAAVRAGVGSAERVFVSLDQVIRGKRRAAVPGHGDRPARACSGSAATRRSSSTRTTGASKRAMVERGAAPAPLRAGRPRSRCSRTPTPRWSPSWRALRPDRRRRLRDERAARLHDPVRDRRPRGRGCATRRGRRCRRSVLEPPGLRHLRRDPQRRHPAAPPVRQLRRERRAVHPRGGRRPADAVRSR